MKAINQKMKSGMLMVACAVMLASCAIEEDFGTQTSKDVKFYPTNTSTRSTETTFEEGDQISVFAVLGSEDTELKAGGNYADNVCYTYNGEVFTAGADNKITLPSSGDGLAYYAVYPYRSVLAPRGSFAVQADQRSRSSRAASDFCSVYVPTSNDRNVYLKFWHRMSRICVSIAGVPAGQQVSMRLKDINTLASYDLNANTYSSIIPVGGRLSDIEMGQMSANCFEAILPPQSFDITSNIIVTIGGKDYYVQSSRPANTFRTGMEYDYQLVYISGGINMHGEPIEVTFDGDIYPWNTLPTSDSNSLENILTVDDSQYVDDTYPDASADYTLYEVSYNRRALRGGSNIFTIVTDKTFKRFYIGVKGISGYLVYAPEPTRDGANNVYTISVIYGSDYVQDMTMLISGEEESGYITKPFEADVTFVDSESGDLNVNLTFSNAKDIDLHMFLPNGQQIFYGARGGTVQTADGRTISYGLDHDSNAGCHIDNLNNENIYIPAELIQPGKYRVVINMFANCNSSISTSWSVVARYKGEYVTATTGRNPAQGIYLAGANNGDHTTVMEFTIEEETSSAPARIKADTFVPASMSDMDVMKWEEEKFQMRYK